jgi:hypothetical protein
MALKVDGPARGSAPAKADEKQPAAPTAAAPPPQQQKPVAWTAAGAPKRNITPVVQTATATAALKALLNGAALDASGTLKPTSLTPAQFKAATEALFGSSGKPTADFKALFGALDGSLAAKPNAPASLSDNVKNLLGPNTQLWNGRVGFRDNDFQSQVLNDDLVGKFGPGASLDATMKASLEASEKQTVTNVAALRALLNGAVLQTKGTLTRTDRAFTDAQFQSTVQALFGPDAKAVNGSYDTKKDGDFQRVWDATDLDPAGNIKMLGEPSQALNDSLRKVLGENLRQASGQLQFKDNSFVGSGVQDEVVKKFGAGAGLGPTLKESAAREARENATSAGAVNSLLGSAHVAPAHGAGAPAAGAGTAGQGTPASGPSRPAAPLPAPVPAKPELAAAFKAVLGNTTIDTTGSGLTIKNGKLTDAQFQAAITTLFGPNAKLSADGSFKWTPDSGVSGDAVAAFKGTVDGIAIDANGALQVKDGKLNAQLAENIKATLGPATVIANNQVVFTDSTIQSGKLNDELIAKFGPSGSLDATFRATIGQIGLQTAAQTAALKTLIGNTALDARGKLKVTDSTKLSPAQFQVALQTLFGPNAKPAADGTFDTSTQPLGADFRDAYMSLDPSLTVIGAKPQVHLQDSIKLVAGPNTLLMNDQVQFKDNSFQSASLNDELISKFGPGASIDATLKASLNRQGIETATSTAALKAVLGNTTIDTTGTGFTIKNNQLTDAQFKAAIKTLFGPNAQLSANGTFAWNKDSGTSADVGAAFKETVKNVTVSADGTLQVKGGKASGQLEASLTTLLGNNTLVSGGQIVFKDNRFASASLSEELKHQFGPRGSIDATLKASIDAEGVVSATATAAFKALVGSTTVDTSAGLTIKNNTLTDAQFKAAIQTVFGPNAKLKANGTFTWDKDSGVSAEAAAAFKGTYQGLDVDASGNLTVKGGKVSATLAENIKATLGNNVIVADNKVVFKDNAFQSATLNDSLTSKFGPNGSLTATLKASIDQGGIASANATAALKAVLGNTTVDADGSFTIKKGQMTDAQLQAAVTTLFGPNAKLQANGTFKWNKDSGISADLAASFKETVKNLTVDANGTLSVKPGGKVDGTLQANVTAVLGNNTVIANNSVIFKDSKFVSATLDDTLKTKFGPDASLSANVKATVTEKGLVDASLSLSAFKRLKEIGKDGGIDVQADGSVVIKDNHIDRAEVSALLSVMAGKDVNLSATGKLVYADGKFDPSFGANLKAAWDNTTVTASGTVTMKDGHPELTGKVGALFGGAKVKGGADITITGADSGQLDLKLQQMGGNTTMSETGSLVVDKGHLTGAGLTTNLVTQGKDPKSVSLGGLISVTDHSAEGNIKAQVAAGIISGGLGVGGKSNVQVYTPDEKDPHRLDIAKKGGVWAEHDASFDINANAGAQGTVMVGPVPLVLGFKADGDKTRQVHTLSIHPSKDDALSQSPLTVIHPPTTVDQVLAMRPYEQYSDSGTQAIGIGGNAGVGFAAGPAAIKAGGSVYYQITGDISRDIERLDGNKVRVRFSRGNGSTDIKALSASVGLDAGKVVPDNALLKKAAPLVSQVAQAGVSATWEKMKEHDTVFDATIDLSTPQGQAAMQHVLKNELAETQRWAGFEGSGVVVNAAIDTNVQAQTRKTDVNIGPLNKENLSRYLDKQQSSLTPNDVTFTQAVDQVNSKKALFPWNQDGRIDSRFVHETHVMNKGAMPEVGDVSTQGRMSVHLPDVQSTRPATLDDSAAMLAMRFRVSGAKTSQSEAIKSIDGGIAMMKAIGFSSGELGQIDDARRAVGAASIAPGKDPIIPLPFGGGIGDERFGQAAVDVEGFLGPKGFNEVFKGRSQGDFFNAYLDAAGVGNSIVSGNGTRAAIEKQLGANLVQVKDGWDVMRGGQKIGNLSNVDIRLIRQNVINSAGSNGGFASIPNTFGTWVGRKPDTLMTISPDQWQDARDVINRASNYGALMGRAQALWAANQQPDQNPNETKAQYDARVQKWQDTSLYKKPDVYYSQMDEIVRQALEADKGPTSGLATMGLAGPNHIYGKANVELPPDKIKAMIDRGRAEVQHFAAIDLLARQGAHLDANSNVVLPDAPENIDAATIAIKQLFGNDIHVMRNGNSVTFTHLTYRSQAFRDAMVNYFSAMRVQNGKMTLNGLSPEAQQQVLNELFDGNAVVDKGQVVFDNRSFGIVHFGDALSMYKGAFGVYKPGEAPPLFPTLVPIQDHGAAQSFDLSGLVARHNGVESHWGDQFSHLEYLHGANEDLASRPQDQPNAWILH